MNVPVILAAGATLLWDSPGPDAVRYRAYVGIDSIVDGTPPVTSYPVDDTTYRIEGLDYGTRYYFVVTAFDSTGFEGPYSNEVSHLPLPPEPTPIPLPTPDPIPIPTATPSPTPPDSIPSPTPRHRRHWHWWNQ